MSTFVSVYSQVVAVLSFSGVTGRDDAKNIVHLIIFE